MPGITYVYTLTAVVPSAAACKALGVPHTVALPLLYTASNTRSYVSPMHTIVDINARTAIVPFMGMEV